MEAHQACILVLDASKCEPRTYVMMSEALAYEHQWNAGEPLVPLRPTS